MIVHWLVFSIIIVALGLVIHFSGFPMNKQLWSPSYLFFMVKLLLWFIIFAFMQQTTPFLFATFSEPAFDLHVSVFLKRLALVALVSYSST